MLDFFYPFAYREREWHKKAGNDKNSGKYILEYFIPSFFMPPLVLYEVTYYSVFFWHYLFSENNRLDSLIHLFLVGRDSTTHPPLLIFIGFLFGPTLAVFVLGGELLDREQKKSNGHSLQKTPKVRDRNAFFYKKIILSLINRHTPRTLTRNNSINSP